MMQKLRMFLGSICADIKWAAVDALNGKLELGGGDDLALGGGIIDRRPD